MRNGIQTEIIDNVQALYGILAGTFVFISYRFRRDITW